MKLRKFIVTAAAAAGLAAGVSIPASAAEAAPVHHAAAPSALGPGWTRGQLKGTGGGCAVPAARAAGAKVVFGPCGSFTWYWRSLGTVPHHGPELEFADPSGRYALTHTPSGWVTAKPSGSTFVVFDTDDESGGACPVQTIGGIGMYPAARGRQLKTTGSGAWSYPVPA